MPRALPVRFLTRLVLGLTAFTLVIVLATQFLSSGGRMTLQAAPLGAPSDGVRAPEFPATFQWLNTDKPLSLRGLRGKIVLLDFWTYG